MHANCVQAAILQCVRYNWYYFIVRKWLRMYFCLLLFLSMEFYSTGFVSFLYKHVTDSLTLTEVTEVSSTRLLSPGLSRNAAPH